MKKTFWILWLVFLVYAIFFSPNVEQETMLTLIKGSFNGQFASVDLSVICVFMAMGVVPFFLGLYLIPVRKVYKPMLWPFWIASYFLGAGALLPYLAIRKEQYPQPLLSSQISLNWFEVFLSNKYLKVIIAVAIFAIVAYGFVKGNPQAYLKAFNQSRLVNVMSFDFCILMFVVWPYLARQNELGLKR